MNATRHRFRRICATSSLLLVLFSPAGLLAREDELIRTVCLVRHGERTPWSSGYTKLRYQWTESPGQLTRAGARQTFLLGKQYADRYIKQLRLLPQECAPNSIHVVCTEMSRTILSARSILAGMYAPDASLEAGDGWWSTLESRTGVAGIQKVPITTITRGQKNHLLSKEQEDAGLFQSNVNRVLKTPEFAALNKEHQTDLDRWGKIAGVTSPIANVWELVGFSDYLYGMVHATPPLPLPDSLSVSEANRIIDTGFTNQARLFSTPFMTRYLASDFVKQLCGDLEAATRTNQECKLTLYVGHDISILPVMAAVGSPLSTNPPYAAHMEFELYRSERGKVFTVRTFYQGASLPIANKDNPTLSEFTNAVAWVMRP